jgi:hypothetical protein
MAPTSTGTVDVYIAKQPAEVQPALRRVRRIIRKALPGAEEALSYNIPTVRALAEVAKARGRAGRAPASGRASAGGRRG